MCCPSSGEPVDDAEKNPSSLPMSGHRLLAHANVQERKGGDVEMVGHWPKATRAITAFKFKFPRQADSALPHPSSSDTGVLTHQSYHLILHLYLHVLIPVLGAHSRSPPLPPSSWLPNSHSLLSPQSLIQNISFSGKSYGPPERLITSTLEPGPPATESRLFPPAILLVSLRPIPWGPSAQHGA